MLSNTVSSLYLYDQLGKDFQVHSDCNFDDSTDTASSVVDIEVVQSTRERNMSA
jgi:hypothetical protein